MRRPTRLHTLLAAALWLASSRCALTADGDAAGDVAEPMRGAGQLCGGFTGRGCEAGLECFYTTGNCGSGGEAGQCVPRPEVCTYIYQPTCGCDGYTYPNRCEAARAGMSVAHHGPCERREGEPAVVGSPRR